VQLSRSFEDLYPDLTGEQAFNLYEDIRARLPEAHFSASPVTTGSLMDVAGSIDAFVFDAFGVLNVGEATIEGAVQRVTDLRALGRRIFVLTNAASHSRAETYAKFNKLGFDFSEDEIVSSRNAAEKALASFPPETVWGVAATSSFDASEILHNVRKLNDDPADYDAVSAFLLLSVQDWSPERQSLLEASLRQNPRPVIVANPDIVAPRGETFSTEPGYFGHRLVSRLGADVQFHGKPFPSVFDIIEERLEKSEIAPARICMVGDTLHTDVLGGAARGWRTVLVTDHGLFKGLDPDFYIRKSGIRPDWMVGSI